MTANHCRGKRQCRKTCSRGCFLSGQIGHALLLTDLTSNTLFKHATATIDTAMQSRDQACRTYSKLGIFRYRSNCVGKGQRTANRARQSEPRQARLVDRAGERQEWLAFQHRQSGDAAKTESELAILIKGTRMRHGLARSEQSERPDLIDDASSFNTTAGRLAVIL